MNCAVHAEEPGRGDNAEERWCLFGEEEPERGEGKRESNRLLSNRVEDPKQLLRVAVLEDAERHMRVVVGVGDPPEGRDVVVIKRCPDLPNNQVGSLVQEQRNRERHQFSDG